MTRSNEIKVALPLVLFVFVVTANLASAQYSKMLVVGNSLTHHAPLGGADGLHWEGDWGMAASQESKDYVHLLHSMIEAAQGSSVALQVEHIDDERYTMSGYSHLLSTDADLMIFQLSDNYSGPATDEAFRLHYQTMVSDIAAGGNSPDIVILGRWWKSDVLEAMIEQVADNLNATYVPIQYLQTYNNMAVSEAYRDLNWISGVEWHPGDRGMQAIANVTYTAISTIPEPISLFCMSAGACLILRRNKRRNR